jgi:glycosyltransferase involved in cell wall biosynthesis
VADCAYVTHGWGIHDERWVQALRDLGHDPVVHSVTDTHVIADIRADLISTPEMPVLAGPLDSVTRHLAGIRNRLVGLSWGFDLHELRAKDDLAWLAQLDGLIVDSEATRQIAEAAGAGPQGITFLPWGIDLRLFSIEGPRASSTDVGLPPARRFVLSLRAHEPRYRVAEIVDAFAPVAGRQADIDLVIGHAGSLTEALRQRVAELDLDARVVFIGSVPEPALAPLLRGCAAYVSASEVDGTSVTLLQAMACGAPLAVSATPGNLGWVEDDVTGFTFTVGNPNELAQALTRALDAPASVVERAVDVVRRDADWGRNIFRLDAALFG